MAFHGNYAKQSLFILYTSGQALIRDAVINLPHGQEPRRQAAEVLGRAALRVGRKKRNLLGTTDCRE